MAHGTLRLTCDERNITSVFVYTAIPRQFEYDATARGMEPLLQCSKYQL